MFAPVRNFIVLQIKVMLHVARGEEDMLAAHDAFGPDAIVAPFLTKRVPDRLWKNNLTCPVLIVHPGVRGDRGISSIDWALRGGKFIAVGLSPWCRLISAG